MQTLHVQPVKLSGTGTNAPPSDMIAAACASLTASGFADLMNQTGGLAPTAEQLCAMVELERVKVASGTEQ
jgi:hypothetical protein